MMAFWNQLTENINGMHGMFASGKLVALFLVALLFLWLAGEGQKKAGKQLLLYSVTMTALVICPVTSAMLSIYQTPFYDYKWLWSGVPVIAVIAFAGTRFWQRMEGSEQVPFFRLRCIAIYTMLFLVVILCGDMGAAGAKLREETGGREGAVEVLEQTGVLVAAHGGTEKEICLWAPREILEWTRAEDGSITLLYGRDMWDGALGAYTYDTYDEECVALYDWMEQEEHPEAEEYVLRARAAGANCILLPGDVEVQMPDDMAALYELGDYRLFLFE